MPNATTRRQWLATASAAPWLARAAATPRNVLMIAVDDLNNRIGCYGDPVVKTPNIDRLAARGVRFDRAYCNYPLCNPSRTSLLSGRYPDTTRVFDNRTPPRTHLGGIPFLPEHFRKHGYFTARVGKIAHGLFEDAVEWDISEFAAGRQGARPAARRREAAGGEAAKLSWQATGNEDAAEPDGRTARRIAQLMGEKRERPFFLGAGFHKPHLPWIAPKKYFDMYPPERIELPLTPALDRDDIPPIALTRTAGDDALTDLDRKTAIAAYHAATSFMDAQVGVLLDAMDRLELWDNTTVLLFGDHGWHLYDHFGLWRKMTVFEESARAPLIVAAPGKKAGAASPRLVEFVDIYPTLVELCGLSIPEGLEGASLAPLLDDPDRRWKKAAFTVVRRGQVLGRSLRTDRYRYTEWGGPETAELYDHQTDPHEWRNLVNETAASATLEVRRMMKAGWRAARP